MCGADDGASLQNYINYENSTGSTVKTFTFPTTPEQEAQIFQNMDDQGAGTPGLCTKAVSATLQGVGPFAGLPSYLLPGSLADDLANRLSGGKPKIWNGFIPPGVF